jgi:hypothetical protein
MEATSIEESRAVAESQAGFVVAQRFPRDQGAALSRVLQSCQRKSLAEQAEYAFPKGGQMVEGPTIRLAEVLAQNWGNILFGIRELQEIEGASMLMAYCYDLETNTRSERIFTVKHVRKAKGKTTQLTDARDIYEVNFNQGARRLRACILQVIPGDVVEMAVEACRSTLEATDADATPENIAKMLKAFAEIDVTEEMVVERMGKKVKALLPAEMVTLRKIYMSLKDGMSKPDQWFKVATDTESLKEKLKAATSAATKAAAEKEKKPKRTRKAKAKAETPPETPPEPPGPPPAPEAVPEHQQGPETPPEPEEPSEDPPHPEPSSDSPSQNSSPESEDGGPTELDFRASTLEVGPKPSQWVAQVDGLRNRALEVGLGMEEWHGAVMTILGQLGYDNINLVPPTNRPPLKKALVILVETLEEDADAS